MGIRKRTCYTIECNECENILENYTGDLIGITDTKEGAEALAKEHGWKKAGKNTWKCPICCERLKS